MTHAELQAAIVDLLHALGWRHLHVRRSIGRGRKWVTATNVTGWPDLFCWTPRQPGRFVAIEVKVAPDDLSDDQRAVLEDLDRSGVECYVIWPDDLEVLSGWLSRRKWHARPDGITNLESDRRADRKQAKHPDPAKRARAGRQ